MPSDGVDDSPSISQVQTAQDAPDWDREVDSDRIDPSAPDAHDVVFSGGGWGHGVGMSQWGAQGAASEHGCSAEEILGTYFPGTSIEQRDSRNTLRLKLWTTDAGGVTSVWVEEETTWYRCDRDGGSCEPVAPPQPAGTTVQVSVTDDAFRIRGGEMDVTVDDRIETVLRLRHDGRLVKVLQGAGDAADTGRPIRYGTLELDFADFSWGQKLFTTQIIDSGGASGLPAMETYLLGLAEVPWSWHEEALRAQVIAARSYAEARTEQRRSNFTDVERIRTYDCRCDLVVTTGDQVWAGVGKQLAEPSYYPAWEEAVTTTADQYVIADGAVLTTFYSSSHGGVSRAGFTSSSPGYVSVDASQWERSVTPLARPEGGGHRRYRWSHGFSRVELESAFGIDDIDALEIAEADPAGYPLPAGVVVRGVDDDEEGEWTFSADSVRARLGLYSPRFTLRVVTDLAADEQVPVARLDGPTRAATAIRLAEAGWSAGSATVVVAREDDPADALTGSALAGTHDAPLLLTPPDGLPEHVAVELQRLAPERVLLLGGPVALSQQVARDVRALGISTVRRVQGETRHGTAVDVASRVSRGDQTTAYLVRLRDDEVEARGWVDALSVAAVAARRAAEGQGWPILGTEATLPDETRAAISDLGITRVVPVGGPDTVPAEVLDELAAMDVEVADRLAGKDRYGTSRAVTATDSPPEQALAIATGENFPDGLAAGPYAARTGAALLLVPTQLEDASPWGDDEHPSLVASFAWERPRLFAVGGPVAIENPVIRRVATLLEDARP